MLEVECSVVSSLPVTGADTQAAALGEVRQVLLCLPHVLVDLVHALLHILQLLWLHTGDNRTV